MRIALVIEHFDARRSGAGHLAVWLAGQLAGRGHEVHVVCHDVRQHVNRLRQATLRASHDPHRMHADAPGALHEGVYVHRLKGMRLNSAVGFRLFGARAGQWLAGHRPDAAHSFTVACPGDIYHAYAGVYAAMQAQAAASRGKPARTPLKHMLLRFPGKQQTLLALERRAVEGRGRFAPAARIISPCEMVTRQFEAAYAIDRRRIAQLALPRLVDDLTTPAGSADAVERRRWLRSHYGIGENDRTALFVGHDFRRKGLRFAIEAVARTRGWRLLIVGLGKTREYVELAAELDLGPGASGGARILFVGPTGEMESVYAASDALLLPAFYEPSNLVALEALSHGLPVISTAYLGAAELVTRHDAGTIVGAPSDVAALAGALEALPAPGSAAQAALAARARCAAEGLSPEAFVDAILKLYEQVRHA